METYLKYEISDQNDSNQIEITMEDIAGGHDEPDDDENDDHKFNLEFIKTLPSDVQELNGFETEDLAKVKTEPFDDTYYENGHLLTSRDEEQDVRLLEKIKKETNIDFEALPIKTETYTKDYTSEADWKTFDHQRNYAFIKEDIVLEDHYVKSETENTTCPTNRSDSDATVLNNNPDTPPFECALCSYATHNKTYLKRHAASFHGDPSKLLWYYCTRCSYKTRQKGHLRRHDLIHLQPSELKLFTCAICDYKFKQKCTLRRHINDAHSHSKRPGDSTAAGQIFKCSECPYSTSKRGLLMSHLDKHKDTRDVTSLYICDICSFSTKYRRNLRVHLQTHQESQELQVYQCDVCRYSTRMGYCLKRHFLSRRHLLRVGKLEEYSPRCGKVKQNNDS